MGESPGSPILLKKAIIMAKKKTQSKSTKRFGPRYGRTVKAKVAKIETMQKKSYKCPTCNYEKVQRVSSGIWNCSKCNAKFTSKAFSVTKQVTLKAQRGELL